LILIDFVKAHPFLARLAMMAAGLVGEYLAKIIREAMRDGDGPDFGDEE